MQKPIIVFSTFDSINHPVYAGGGARAIHQLATRLSKYFYVKIIAGAYPGSKDQVIDQVSYHFVGFRHINPQVGQLLFHLLLPLYVRKEKFEIWFESFTPPFSTSCLQIFTRKPIIGLVHMLSGEDMQRKYFLPFEKIERLGLKTYKLVITTTAFFQKKIRQLAPNTSVVVIPNGFELATTREFKKVHTPYFLYLGRIEINQKGLDLLIEAFAKVRESLPHNLIIAGNGSHDEESRLKELIQKFQLKDRVELVGRVEGSDKFELLNQAELVVVSSRFETFGLTALEAFGCGKTVVSFDIPQFSWITPQMSYKAEAFDTNAFAKRLAHAVIFPEVRKKKEALAWEFSQNYTWDNIAQKYRQLISDLLSKPVSM